MVVRRLVIYMHCCDECPWNRCYCMLTDRKFFNDDNELIVPTEWLSEGFPPDCPLEVVTS